MTRPNPKRAARKLWTRKGHPPAPSKRPGVRCAWRPKLDPPRYVFRARFKPPGLERQTGPWRDYLEDALQDRLDMHERAGEVEDADDCWTLAEAMQRFLERSEERGMPASTLRCYAEHFKTLIAFFGADTLLAEIDVRGLDAFVSWRLQSRYKRCRCDDQDECDHPWRRVTHQRINKNVAALGTVMRFAKGKKAMPSAIPHDDEGFQYLSVDDDEEIPTYEPEEVGAILTAIRARATTCPTWERLHAIVLVLFGSGMRLGELALVRIRNIDTERGTLTWERDETTRSRGKTGIRTVYLNAISMYGLDVLMQGRGRDDFVLPEASEDKRKEAIKSGLFESWRQRIPEALRGRFHAHEFRSAHQTRLERCRVPDVWIRKLLGRKVKRDVHGGYSRPTPLQLGHEVRSAFDPLADMLLGNGESDRHALLPSK